jgi:hypothetical protein
MDEQEQEDFFRRSEYAKVDREKLFLPSASVSFSPFVEQNKYRLIELNEHLESALRHGEDVVIRGTFFFAARHLRNILATRHGARHFLK